MEHSARVAHRAIIADRVALSNLVLMIFVPLWFASPACAKLRVKAAIITRAAPRRKPLTISVQNL